MIKNAHRSITLPADRLFWARLETAELGGRPKRETLLYLFEAQVPVALEDIHITLVRAKPHTWIACALARTELDALLIDAPDSLCPDSIPEFLGVDLDPCRIELLSGEYLPRALRRWKRAQHGIAACAILATLGIFAACALRRAQVLTEDAQIARAAESELYQKQLGYSLSPERLPGPLQAASELRALTKTRISNKATTDPELARVLESLLERIPGDLKLEAESLHVTRESIHLRASLANAIDAQRLALVIGDLEGYRAEIPEVRTVGSSCSAAYRWTRVEVQR